MQKKFTCPCELSEFCARRPDKEIVEFAKFNKECYRVIVERYEGKLSRLLRTIPGASKKSHEDILENIFLKAYFNLSSYKPRMEFFSWIYRIASFVKHTSRQAPSENYQKEYGDINRFMWTRVS